MTKTMAEVLYHEGAWCGDCEYEGWDECSGCRDTCEGYARALTAAGFGLVADAKAEALESAAADAEDCTTHDMEHFHIDQADVGPWLRRRAFGLRPTP